MPALVQLLLDPFTLLLTLMVVLASFIPVQGDSAITAGYLVNATIALLFFLHGARLSRTALLEGLSHWRLHLVIIAITFGLYPLLGWLLQPLLSAALGSTLAMGVLFLCALPGTVQSAIAFTAIAGGNLPAGVCNASGSSILGIVFTPVLVALLLGEQDAMSANGLVASIYKISLQLLLPFVLGHLLHPLLSRGLERHNKRLSQLDQGAILLVVYAAFSASVVQGLWEAVSLSQLITLGIAMLVLVCAGLAISYSLACLAGFGRADRITLVFCSSKKSMATGVPMAQLLFSGAMLGPMLLPLLIFHQLQLMICAQLARRWAQETASCGQKP